jgi:hypothetical protein
MQASVATAIPNASLTSLTKTEQQEEYDTHERSLRSPLASAHGQLRKITRGLELGNAFAAPF